MKIIRRWKVLPSTLHQTVPVSLCGCHHHEQNFCHFTKKFPKEYATRSKSNKQQPPVALSQRYCFVTWETQWNNLLKSSTILVLTISTKEEKNQLKNIQLIWVWVWVTSLKLQKCMHVCTFHECGVYFFFLLRWQIRNKRRFEKRPNCHGLPWNTCMCWMELHERTFMLLNCTF